VTVHVFGALQMLFKVVVACCCALARPAAIDFVESASAVKSFCTVLTPLTHGVDSSLSWSMMSFSESVR
jgi:hypothetical protein